MSSTDEFVAEAPLRPGAKENAEGRKAKENRYAYLLPKSSDANLIGYAIRRNIIFL